jgi:8-oxo-dGTP pyrophosphatase MutT (NUDIX family)
MDEFTLRLQQKLQSQGARIHSESEARLAAVLIPLYSENGSWHVLYTKRTDEVEEHRGQVSFPGGIIESNDINYESAALRETDEEIGIDPGHVTLLGKLDAMLTITDFQIVPVVGVIPWPYELTLNSTEVDHVFGVPISWLAEPANLESHSLKSPDSERQIPVYTFKPYQGEIIWGATARITRSLLKLIE